MAEGQEPHTPPPDRSRRAAIFATLGIVVILGLAVFFVAVVAPFLETHAAVRAYADPPPIVSFRDAGRAIGRLGDPERAANRLQAYLRLPRWMKADRGAAVHLLNFCGKPGLRILIAMARDTAEDDEIRLVAVNELRWHETSIVATERLDLSSLDDVKIEDIIKTACEATDLQYEPLEPHD